MKDCRRPSSSDEPNRTSGSLVLEISIWARKIFCIAVAEMAALLRKGVVVKTDSTGNLPNSILVLPQRDELGFECREGMSKLKMPGMRYAVIKVSGDIHKVATAWDYLYRDWLINSAYEPEHAPALEVFLDKESATDWSHFELELCLPVRNTGRDAELT